MANSFSKSEVIFFEKVLEGFQPNNVVARNCTLFEPDMKTAEQSGLTVRRPIPMIGDITTGRDITGQYKDVLELTVPSTLSESDIMNHPFKLNALELNDPSRRDRAARAATQALAAKIDTRTSDEVATYGTLVATETGNFTNYDALSKGETMLTEREVRNTLHRTLVLNPRMAQKMANELASRATDNSRDRSAYEKSLLPPVAGFETLKANSLTAITGSASSGVTVNGANQRKTPTAFDKNNHAAADNRYMTLAVSTGHGLAAGDAFTIAGVKAVGMITKKDTGQLQTFRVIAVDGDNLTISPAIIPYDYASTGGSAFAKYANVNTTPASGAAITVLNTDTAQPSIFFCEPAVEIFHGRLAVGDMSGSVSIMREVTDSGIEIIFAKEGNIDDLTVKYRLTCWASPNVIAPEMCGIYLPNQNAAFG